MFSYHRRGKLIGLVRFPVSRLRTGDIHSRLVHRVFESELSLDAVERVGMPFKNSDFVPLFELFRQKVACKFRPFAVIRPDKWNLDFFILQGRLCRTCYRY